MKKKSFKKSYIKLFKAHLRGGAPIAGFGKTVGVSIYTVRKWLAENPAFAAVRDNESWFLKGKCVGGGTAERAREDPIVSRRFWANVEKKGRHQCWLWKGRTIYGYGKCSVHQVGWRAHRLALALSGANVNPNDVVCHKCDVRLCVNPHHLYIGTHQQNMDDGKKRARFQRLFGESNRMALLTWAKVDEMRALKKRGLKIAEISQRYGVAEVTAAEAISGKTWPSERRPPGA